MDKVLAFSILSASPADIAPGAGATGGSWARLSWRGMKLQDAQAGQQGGQAAEAEQQLGKGKSQSQLPARRPRFAAVFQPRCRSVRVLQVLESMYYEKSTGARRRGKRV